MDKEHTAKNMYVIHFLLLYYVSCIHMQAIMLVYDVTKERTFTNVSKWLRNIEEVRVSVHTYSVTLCIV